MSYTDAEMLMATQVAYLDFENTRGDSTNVSERVYAILETYGTYDRATGNYIMKDGLEGKAKAQFETAQNILDLEEQNNVISWREWEVVDVNNSNDESGYYGCLIDTGQGDAIIGCRGSESYNRSQIVKDWIIADFGRVNNPLTDQQADATEYIEYLYDRYGEKYDSFSLTGHSLGGSLATHSAITAPEGMQEKLEQVISYDGPGFSDEYLCKYKKEIDRIKDKITHYEYSWVGSLLFQPDGINDKVVKAHDDETAGELGTVLGSQIVRHHTRNVEFDQNGNVIQGERGYLQEKWGSIVKLLEISPERIQLICLTSYLAVMVNSYLGSVSVKLMENLKEMVKEVSEKVNELVNNYLTTVVSGNYEISTREIIEMSEDLATVQIRLNQIASQVDEIRKNLPYDSASAYYYKCTLGKIANTLESEGKKAKKISGIVDKAVTKYNHTDQNVAGLF